MGLRRLRELRALPRASLLRRFPAAVVEQLDRLHGDAPCTLGWYRPPDRFEARIEFDYDVESSQALLFPLRRLTADLAAFLRSRDGGVQRFSLWLEHERTHDSEVVVGLLSPEREASVLFELARGRLERAGVPAPVRGLQLRAIDLPRFVPESAGLFDVRARQHLPWLQLQERLRARLGDAAVRSPAWCADHRPERVPTGVDAKPPSHCAMPRRPGWLLPAPAVCRDRLGTVLAGPERIESGWWDGGDTRRDYYVADTAAGLCRAALPLRLQLPARRVQCARAVHAREAMRLCRARDHRRMLAGRHRARARGGIESRPAADRRQRDVDRRRPALRAAGRIQGRLFGAVRAHHRGAPARGKRPVPAAAR
jgi:protein ImuB